jgi:chromosome segregation ATPase
MWTTIFEAIASLLGKELSVAAEMKRSAEKLAKQKKKYEAELAVAYGEAMKAQAALLEARRKNEQVKADLAALNDRAMKLDREKTKVDVPPNPY